MPPDNKFFGQFRKGVFGKEKGFMGFRKSGASPSPTPFPNTYSLDFDGVNELLDCGDFSAYDTGDLSFSVWVYKTSALPNPQYVMSNSASGGVSGFDVIIDRYDSVAIRRNTPTTDAYTGYVTSVGFTLNNWHQIVGTYEDSTETVKLYVDGVLQDTTVGSASVNSASTDLSIGSATGGTNFFVGNIDEVSIYSATLSAPQVTDLYNSGSPTDLSSFAVPPFAWYRMGDSTKALYFNSIWQIPNEMKVGNFSQYSFFFDGVNEYFTLGSSVSLGTVHTISIWVTYSSGNRVALGGTSEYAIFITGTNVYTHPNGGGYYNKTIATIGDGNWHHICFSRNGSTITWYHNGVDIGTSTVSGTCSVGTIGAYDGGGYGYLGHLSNIALFDEAKSSVEVSAIYNSGTPTDLSAESGLEGYWLMGEDAIFNDLPPPLPDSWIVPDDSPNTNLATSSNVEISDRKTNAPGNLLQANSINMESDSRVESVPS